MSHGAQKVMTYTYAYFNAAQDAIRIISVAEIETPFKFEKTLPYILMQKLRKVYQENQANSGNCCAKTI